MKFQHVATANPSLTNGLIWLWFSKQRNGFVVGDDKSAFLLPIASPGAPIKLSATEAAPNDPFNLPLPADLQNEFCEGSWHGFKFLPRADYPRIGDGDLLRTLVFGPDYGLPLIHPANGAIIKLKGGSMELLVRDGDKFRSIEKTKTRGKSALAFAAHPTQPLIAYGDNYGTFHAHRVEPTAFGKASKILVKDRKASQLEFIHAGETLLIGGMGYLLTLATSNGKFSLRHEAAIAVRSFCSLNNGERILVNQGTNGLAAYSYTADGFQLLASVNNGEAVAQLGVSACGNFVATTYQNSSAYTVYELRDV